MRKINILLMMLMVAGLVASAHAWELLDNFDGYANGPIDEVTGGVWSRETDDSSVTVTDGELYIYKNAGSDNWDGSVRALNGTDAAVTVGEIQTYFWQVKVWSDWDTTDWTYDIMLGLAPETSNIDQINAWQDFAIMPYINNAPANPYINAVSPSAPYWAAMTPDTWTNVWVVINNDAVDPTFDLYYSRDAAADGTAVLVEADCDWRNVAVNQDLNAIGFMAAGWDLTHYWIDNICYTAGEDLTVPPLDSLGSGPYDPVASPYNEADDTVGVVNGSFVEATLSFKAGKDPNTARGLPVNPDILTHYIYWDDSDPNLPVSKLKAAVDHVNYNDPNISYFEDSLPLGKQIWWKVEEGLQDPAESPGTARNAGDPNNITGPVWTFTSVTNTPQIVTQPRPAVADPDASFTVSGGTYTDGYEWRKVKADYPYYDVITSSTDGGIYSGYDTPTLTVTGPTVAQEAQLFCVPKNGATTGDPSDTVQMVTPRLVGYWKLDGDMTDSVTDEEPDGVTHDGFMAYGDPNYVTEPDVDGFDGNGMRFYNDGQFMELPDEVFFNFYVDGFTLIYWYKPYSFTDPVSTWRVTMSKFDLQEQGWLVGQAGTNPDPDFIIEYEQLNADIGPMTNGQWNMAAVTYDPDDDDTFVLYSNGAENDRDSLDMSTQPLPVRPVQIGGDDAGGTPIAINDVLSEIRMYSYALTPEEIATFYTDNVANVYICADQDNENIDTLDLTGDCRINMEDFTLIASEWLLCQRVPTSACDWPAE